MAMQHRDMGTKHGHSGWTCIGSSMDMQLEHAAWTCSMETWTWSMGMKHGYALFAGTMNMQNRHA